MPELFVRLFGDNIMLAWLACMLAFLIVVGVSISVLKALLGSRK